MLHHATTHRCRFRACSHQLRALGFPIHTCHVCTQSACSCETRPGVVPGYQSISKSCYPSTGWQPNRRKVHNNTSCVDIHLKCSRKLPIRLQNLVGAASTGNAGTAYPKRGPVYQERWCFSSTTKPVDSKPQVRGGSPGKTIPRSRIASSWESMSEDIEMENQHSDPVTQTCVSHLLQTW